MVYMAALTIVIVRWPSLVLFVDHKVRIQATPPRQTQGGFDGRGKPTASPMLTAIMSGGVGICGRELYKYR